MIECSCMIFVGDPHNTTRKPGRRKDTDFSSTVIGKIAQAVDIANEHDGQLAFLGDMFDRAYEDDESIKIRLMREFRRAKYTPVAIDGNHDKVSSVLSDRDSLAVIAESGLIRLHQAAGPIGRYRIGGVRLGLGGSPHGQPIPNNVDGVFEDVDGVIWLTHEDLAFEGAYPGAQELREIKGVQLVVNGHMHLTKPVRQVGETMWFNPGNITRMAVDAVDHVPAVWKFDPENGIERIELSYVRDIFDMTGRLVASVSPGEIPEVDDAAESVFVELLRAENTSEIEKTLDGSALMEEMISMFEADNTPDDVRTLLFRLHGEAVRSAA